MTGRARVSFDMPRTPGLRSPSRRKAAHIKKADLDDRMGWKRPADEGDDSHPVALDLERHRVICRSCPWFWERVGATTTQLRGMGQRHRQNMREASR